jgi:hypothetical protein
MPRLQTLELLLMKSMPRLDLFKILEILLASMPILLKLMFKELELTFQLPKQEIKVSLTKSETSKLRLLANNQDSLMMI